MKLQENKCAGCPTRRFRFNTRLHYTIIKASIQKPTRLGDESKTEINGTVVPEHIHCLMYFINSQYVDGLQYV